MPARFAWVIVIFYVKSSYFAVQSYCLPVFFEQYIRRYFPGGSPYLAEKARVNATRDGNPTLELICSTVRLVVSNSSIATLSLRSVTAR